VDVRAIEHDDGQAVAEAIAQTLRSAAADGGCEIEVEIAQPYSAYRVPSDSEALRLALAAFARLGLQASSWETRGGSDANVLCERGLDCVNLTHGVMGFHAPDERVSISDLELMRTVMLQIIAEAVTPIDADH
jgi:tripeptide aminopeptidase